MYLEQAIHGGLEWWVMDCLSKEKINKSTHHTPLFTVFAHTELHSLQFPMSHEHTYGASLNVHVLGWFEPSRTPQESFPFFDGDVEEPF